MAIVERTLKDGTKHYYAVVTVSGRRRWIAVGDKPRLARQMEADLMARAARRQLPSAPDIKFSALVDRYLANGTHHLREQTMTTYTSRLNNHLLPFFGEMRVRRSVNAEAVGRWMAFCRHNKVSDKSIRRCLVTLSAVMSYAVSTNLVAENPVARVKAPKGGDEGTAGVDYVLSPEQVALLVSHTPKGNDRALMTMLFHAGARPSECAELRFGDCDWSAGTITISRTATKRGVNGTKNGTARTVPMTPTLRAELSEQKRLMNAGSDDLCFPTRCGKRRDMQRFARDVLRPSLTRAGLRVPHGSASCYLGRKTFISTLINNQGVSLKMVSELAGSSPAQILKTYQKVRREDAHDAMRRMDAMMTAHPRESAEGVA